MWPLRTFITLLERLKKKKDAASPFGKTNDLKTMSHALPASVRSATFMWCFCLKMSNSAEHFLQFLTVILANCQLTPEATESLYIYLHPHFLRLTFLPLCIMSHICDVIKETDISLVHQQTQHFLWDATNELRGEDLLKTIDDKIKTYIMTR